MMNNLRSAYPPLLMMVFGIIIIYMIPYQIDQQDSSTLGPRFFPYLISVSIIVISAFSIVKNLLMNKENVEDERTKISRAGLVKVVLVVISLIAWIILLKHIGFFVTTLLLNIVLMLIIGHQGKLKLFLIAITFTTIMYILSKVILNLQLPDGILI